MGSEMCIRDRLCSIPKVVISHWHRDHYGGLLGLIRECPKVEKVYAPSMWRVVKEIERLNVGFVECKSKRQVYNYVIASGPIYSSREQVLKVKVKDLGVLIFTGCGHAGISNILRWVVKSGERVYGIIGGIHVRRDFCESPEKIAKLFKELNIEKLVLLHHKFKRGPLRRLLSDYIVDCGVGSILKF